MTIHLSFSALLTGCQAQFDRGLFPQTLRASYSLQGSKLQNSVIRTHIVRSKLECGRICLEEPTCASINWKKSSKQCELNSSDNDAILVPDADFVYLAPRKFMLNSQAGSFLL